MSKWWRHIAITAVLIFVAGQVSAQFYSWGADPESMHWNKIKGEKIGIIYPDTARASAYRLLHYVKAVQPDIGFGL